MSNENDPKDLNELVGENPKAVQPQEQFPEDRQQPAPADPGFLAKIPSYFDQMAQQGAAQDQMVRDQIALAGKQVHDPNYAPSEAEQQNENTYFDSVTGAVAGSLSPTNNKLSPKPQGIMKRAQALFPEATTIEELAAKLNEAKFPTDHIMVRQVNKVLNRVKGYNKPNFAEGGAVETPPGLDEFLSQAPTRGPAGVQVPEGLDEFLAPELKEAKFGSVGQQALAGVEGAAQGVAGPLAPAAELASGLTTEENIRGRAETNPVAHYGGEIAGLAGSMAAGYGLGAAASKLGTLGAKAIGIAGTEALIPKIGSEAVKAALENVIISGSDETAKMILKDPNQTAETALTDIGLSGLIGGAAGGALASVSPLWKATMGGKVGTVLDALQRKAGGVEGAIPDTVHTAIQTSGMDIAPEVQAALSSDPQVRQMFQSLQESATSSGVKAQEALKNFRSQASESLVNALGKPPEEIAHLASMSEYDIGSEIKKSLQNQIKEITDPISEQFTKVRERFKGTPIQQTDTADIASKISDMANNEGYFLSPSSTQAKTINRVLEELPNIKTLEDLRKYTSVVGDTTNNPELWRLGGQLKKILRGTEEAALERTIGEEAPGLLSTHAEARAAYKNSMDMIERLNDRLHVGRYNGPGSFIKALGEMSPEDALRRLSPKGDAGIIGELGSQFPNTANLLRDFHLSQALKTAASRAAPGEVINPNTFFTAFDKMSPEMQKFIVPEASSAKMEAIRHLIEGLPSKMNNSGTAKTLDSLWGHLPGSAMGLMTVLTGHSPLSGILIGGLGKALGRDVPDAIKLATLKFLGSNQPIESEGFKSMVDFIHHTIQGENLISKASKNVFKAGREVLPESYLVTERDREKLDKSLKQLQKTPEKMLNTGGKTSHYLPDHGQAISQTAANAVNFLNSQRPSYNKLGPLDTSLPPSPQQKAEYNRALDIAQQPLTVLDKIKSGTVTPKDIQLLNTLYPALYSRLQQKLSTEMLDSVTKGNIIPYNTRLGLSMFLQQPLDSTMVPSSIMAAQPMPTAQQQTMAGQNPKPPSESSTKGLNKLPATYQTSNQSRQIRSQRN